MVNFMLDPKGEMPWDEDATAQDVLHLNNPKVIAKRIIVRKPFQKTSVRIFNVH